MPLGRNALLRVKENENTSEGTGSQNPKEETRDKHLFLFKKTESNDGQGNYVFPTNVNLRCSSVCL